MTVGAMAAPGPPAGAIPWPPGKTPGTVGLEVAVHRLMTYAIGALVVLGGLDGGHVALGQATAPAAAASPVPSLAGAGAMDGKVLVDDIAGPVRLAASPTGQTLSVLRIDARDVLGVDIDDPAKRWTAVPAAAGVEPRAVGAIDSSTLALVVRENETWSIRVHRLLAPGTPGTAEPAQTVKLGSSPETTDEARIILSPSRDWLAVTGLPAPMPRMVRLTVTGARLGTPSERRCPPLSVPPQAVTVGTGGEWGLFMPPAPDGPARTTFLAWVSPSGAQRLLHLDTGLEEVRDAACCRETGLLWAIAGTAAGGEEGLWRVDAAYVHGRQVARASNIAPLASPTSVICLPKGAVAVSHGTSSSRIIRFSPRDGDRTAAETGSTKEPGR